MTARLPAPLARLAGLLPALALLLLASLPAQAQLNLRIGGGAFQPMPVAVVDFSGEPSLGLLVSGVVTNDLKRSGYFTPVDRSKFPEQPGFDAVPRFDAWKGAGVQGLVVGRVTRDPSGHLAVGEYGSLHGAVVAALTAAVSGRERV